MPDLISNRMPEYISDKLSEKKVRMLNFEYVCQYIFMGLMVRITRNKIIFPKMLLLQESTSRVCKACGRVCSAIPGGFPNEQPVAAPPPALARRASQEDPQEARCLPVFVSGLISWFLFQRMWRRQGRIQCDMASVRFPKLLPGTGSRWSCCREGFRFFPTWIWRTRLVSQTAKASHGSGD